jgi:uncharacterized protein YjbJ (UPF0337 family)
MFSQAAPAGSLGLQREKFAHCENRDTVPLTAFDVLDTFRFVGSGSSSESLDPALSPGRSSDSSGLIFVGPRSLVGCLRYSPHRQGGFMGLLDKLLGRGKKAAGDLTGSSSLRSEGVHQEAEGATEDAAASHETQAQAEREQAAEHHAERETGA